MKNFNFKILISLFCIIVLSSELHSQQYVWIQKASFGGGGRYAAFGFALGNKGYIGSGVGFSGGAYQFTYVDFWEWDQITDTWTQKADLPGNCVEAPSAFAIGTKGYVTLGWTPAQTDSTFEYDPSSNVWTQKANYGGGPRYTAAAFTIDSVAYVGTGYTPLSTDFWKYNPVTDSWTQIADIGGFARQAAAGFAINGYGYVFGGGVQFGSHTNDLWQYDPVQNSWTQKTNCPCTPRSASTAFSISNYGFVGGGCDDNITYTDFWRYDPSGDSWLQIEDFGGPKIEAVSFSIGNKGYVGTGSMDFYPNIILSSDFWELTFTDANNISGKLFIDFNNNNIRDAGEPPVANRLMTEANSGRFSFSKPDGSYNLAVLTPGSFIVSTDSVGYFAPNPASHTVNFSGINETDSLNDFAFQATAAINDLCVTITPAGNFRSGFDAYYTISYENSGTTVLPATVIFFPDTSVSFLSASVTPDSVYADSVVWDLGLINPFQQGSINITVHVDAGIAIGTLINSSVRIEPVAGDANPTCNYNSWEVQVTGSFDPNDILVNFDTLDVSQLLNPPYLEYLVRFQNTGNDTAFTVDVLNPVPTGVDLNSFELVSSSHPVAIRYIQDYNTLSFKFSNILLVDSNTNEPLSHGFARYRIKPLSSLTAGSIIQNIAGIYFDFNPVVSTNTALTHIINTTSVQEISSNSLTVAPNPVKDKIYVSAKGTGEYKISIFNTEGKCLLKSILQGRKIEIPFKNFASGIYLIKVEGGSEIIREKIYKE